MRKIVRYYVKNADEFEIPKEDIIHTRVILEKNSNEQILEVWYLEK